MHCNPQSSFAEPELGGVAETSTTRGDTSICYCPQSCCQSLIRFRLPLKACCKVGFVSAFLPVRRKLTVQQHPPKHRKRVSPDEHLLSPSFFVRSDLSRRRMLKFCHFRVLAQELAPTQMPERRDMAASAAESVAANALRSVLQRVQLAAESASRPASQIRVVAVSKTKPVSLLREVYDAGHRHFGENYVQEISEKAPQLPDDIRWHFIGHLQSNKAKGLVAGVPNLYMVEGVDSTKVANNLDRAVAGLGRPPLKVLVQVNTSGEESKFGLEPSKCLELARHVKMECPNLIFSGLMTIGMADYTSTPLNFSTLATCRDDVCKELDLSPDQCELSMGMSGDFELAIQMGSTNVRVGSTIFGPRSYPPKK